MTSITTTIKNRIAKRRAYRQTRDEIRHMPLDVALDLGIYREDADRIAARAVYG